MLDMGFAEDLEAILDETPSRAGRRCCSRPRCRAGWTALARRHLRDPVRITIGREKAAPGRRRACARPPTSCRARPSPPRWAGSSTSRRRRPRSSSAAPGRRSTPLTETLNGRGYRAEALHGGMSQEQRDRVMGRLRGGTADLLVATDVAARGLDIEQLTHVVNYDVPSAPESYVHRIGRVGRAGREGVAVTLAEPREHRMLKTIERVAGAPITVEKVPTVADLRARRLELTRAALRESLLTDDGETAGPVPGRRRDAHRRVRPHGGRPRRGQARARGRRRHRRRRGDPAGGLPARQGGREAGRSRRRAAGAAAAPGGPPRPAVRRARSRGGRAAGRPGRGDHGGDRPDRARRGGDRDPPAVRPRRGARRGGRRGGARRCARR